MNWLFSLSVKDLSPRLCNTTNVLVENQRFYAKPAQQRALKNCRDLKSTPFSYYTLFLQKQTKQKNSNRFLLNQAAAVSL